LVLVRLMPIAAAPRPFSIERRDVRNDLACPVILLSHVLAERTASWASQLVTAVLRITSMTVDDQSRQAHSIGIVHLGA
jgi:hypothetical protein